VRSLRPRSGLWGHADFLKLWAGQSISEFGSQISPLAVGWLAAVSLHASPIEFSLLEVLTFLPFILLALPAGVWVDRWRRRPVLIAGDAARAALLAYIPIAWALDVLTIWQLLPLQFAIGTFTVFFDVAYQSYLPSLVERDQLVEGNSKLQTTASAAQIGGPGLAGVLIGVITAPYAVVVDAASFVLSVLFMLRIRRPERPPERAPDAPKPRLLPELKEGLSYVLGHRYLKWIALCTSTSNFFGQIGFVVSLLYFVRVLHLSSFAAGAVFSCLGIGAIGGALTTTRVQRLVGVGRAIWIPAALFSLGWLAFPLAPQAFPIPVLVAGALVGGYGSMVYNISQVSLRQAITPERLQGRMNASMRWLVWGTLPLGQLTGGAIATAWGLRTALWVGALGGAFTFLPVLLSSVRSIGEMPEPLVEPAEAEGAGGIVEPTSRPVPVSSPDA
jgi:MFS family permease